MEIKTYLTIIARRWWMILLVTLAVSLISVYISPMFPPKYEAVTSLRVITPIGGSLGDISYQTYYADRLSNTYAQIASSEEVTNEVKAQLNLKTLPDISVKTVANSEIIDITVSGPDPDIAAQTANTIADVMIKRSQQNVENGENNPETLNILNSRQAALQKDLDKAKQDRENLVALYAQTTSRMNILDRSIQMQELEYNNLLTEYQKSVIDEAVATYRSTQVPAKTTKDILSKEIDQLNSTLVTMRNQYQELSASSVTYSQQIISLGQSIQSQENAYQNLLTQIDSAKIANSKHVSAQDLMIASPAVTPEKPSRSGGILIVGLGIICGLIGGILLSFLTNALDTRVLNTEQIQNLTSLPILGRLPNLSRKDRNEPLKSKDIKVQRAFGTLCTKILLLIKSRPVKTILILSPNPDEGKTIAVKALAEGLAKFNRRVLVVDTDLRKPGLLNMFNVSTEHGLINYLYGEETLAEAIQVLPIPGVHFLPSGKEDDDPASLFHTLAFADLMGKFADYDIVLFDSPALLAVPDAYSLATQVDGIILLIEQKRTTVEDIQAALSQLEDVQSKLIGTIINRVPLKRISGYYNYQQRRRKWSLSHLFMHSPAHLKPASAQSKSDYLLSANPSNKP